MNSEKRKIRVTIICVVCALFIAVALRIHHSNRAVDAILDRADSLLTVGEADSAMTLLDSLAGGAGGGSPSPLGEARRGRFHLLQADAMNKTYRPFTTDSILKEVVDYYDRHGTPNERLRARYLLGCAYRDMGESPQAIESYQDAISAADTTSSTCDFKTLSSVYSQMADSYHRQLALSDAIESRHNSIYYSMCIQDTLNALYDIVQMASDYILTNRRDSAEALLLMARQMYLECGRAKEWYVRSLPLAYLYLQNPQRLDEAKRILDQYKSAYSNVLSDTVKPFTGSLFFFYMGRYYESIERLDSAEFFYRKMFYRDMKFTHQDAMYRGLLSVFKMRGDVDSIYKYTVLYCQANDSSVAAKDRETVMHMSANYKYGRLQREAAMQRERTAEALNWMFFFIALAVVLLTISIVVLLFYRRRRRQKQAELERLQQELIEARSAYTEEIKKLSLLESTHKKVIELIQHDLKASQGESERYRSKYEETQQKFADIHVMYEESIRIHNDEVQRLKAKIDSLNQRIGVSDDLNMAHNFRESDIVKRILNLAAKSKYELSMFDWSLLHRAFGQYYPTLLSDLHSAPSIKDNGIKVCIMVIIKLRESDIAHFMNISDTSVSNYKSDLNLALFNEKSARTLLRNIEQRYGIIT